MSLCDTCKRPGHCCSGFMLGGGSFPPARTREEAQAQIDKQLMHRVDGTLQISPFELMYLENFLQADHVTGIKDWVAGWKMRCTKLVNGRCSIYDTRPQLCKDYAPATDSLCFHHVPAEWVQTEWEDEWCG
jgi:Fe-S-cluster containining protein